MNFKFMIFVPISVFIVAAFYSSSIPDVFAKTVCSHTKGANFEVCTNTDTEIFKICTYPPKYNNGVRECPSLKEDLPTGLNALEATIQETQNTTKAPNTDFLKK
jgi:hypothetical protein